MLEKLKVGKNSISLSISTQSISIEIEDEEGKISGSVQLNSLHQITDYQFTSPGVLFGTNTTKVHLTNPSHPGELKTLISSFGLNRFVKDIGKEVKSELKAGLSMIPWYYSKPLHWIVKDVTGMDLIDWITDAVGIMASDPDDFMLAFLQLFLTIYFCSDEKDFLTKWKTVVSAWPSSEKNNTEKLVDPFITLISSPKYGTSMFTIIQMIIQGKSIDDIQKKVDEVLPPILKNEHIPLVPASTEEEIRKSIMKWIDDAFRQIKDLAEGISNTIKNADSGKTTRSPWLKDKNGKNTHIIDTRVPFFDGIKKKTKKRSSRKKRSRKPSRVQRKRKSLKRK